MKLGPNSRDGVPEGGKSFQQAYNVQAGVDIESMLVVTESVTTHANDKQEVAPTLKALEELAGPLGRAEAIRADNGDYCDYCEANLGACEAAGGTAAQARGSQITTPFDSFLANGHGNVQLSDPRCSTVIAKSDRLLASQDYC